MLSLDRFNRYFASKELTPGIRFTALLLGLAGTVLLIPTAFFFFALPISLPGLILYGHYWQIYNDKMTAARTLPVWYGTLIYNLVLAVGFGILTEGKAWPFVLGQVGVVGIAINMIRITREKIAETTEAHPETV